MSVLLNYAIFPTDKGISVSSYVKKITNMLSNTCYNYQITSMGSIIETDTLAQALELVQKSYQLLEHDSERVYISANFDIQTNKEKSNRIYEKIKSVTPDNTY